MVFGRWILKWTLGFIMDIGLVFKDTLKKGKKKLTDTGLSEFLGYWTEKDFRTDIGLKD